MAKLSTTAALLCLGWALVLCFDTSSADQNRFIANDSYTYRVNGSDGKPCLTMSFNAHFVISYYKVNESNQTNPTYSVQEQSFDLPDKTETTVVGECSRDPSTSPSYRYITFNWLEGRDSNFTLSFNFTVDEKKWDLAEVGFEFEINNDTFTMPKETGYQSYQTSEGQFFNRSFTPQQYFYCKACKKLYLRVQNDDTAGNDTGPCFVVPNNKDSTINTTVCSFLQISNSVIFPGDVQSGNIKKKLCLEDFIELQEIVIPSVVGGILAVLLFVIFTSYLIAYIRRKRKEGQYETLNDGGY